jgi:hypothetical protein
LLDRILQGAVDEAVHILDGLRRKAAARPAAVGGQTGVEAPQVVGGELLEGHVSDPGLDAGAGVVAPDLQGGRLDTAGHSRQPAIH